LELVPPVSRRSRWKLTPEAFECLLDRLSQDRELAARNFEELRRYLITLLTYAGADDPEHLTDIAFDRAAKRLAEGEQIDNLKAWLRGAARKVLQESWQSIVRQANAARTPHPKPESGNIEEDHLILEECLSRLSQDGRSVIERYYRSETKPLLAVRSELAQELGVSAETLRTRALRLRRILEKCFEEHRGQD
jgi:DNA-directed RNA polymerase specialized sigma24 family protein